MPVRAISGWETIKFHFSNTIAPVVVSGVLKVMEILSAGTERPDKLERNASYRGKGLTEAGFVLKKGDTPIISVMLVNAKLSQDFSKALYDGGKSAAARQESSGDNRTDPAD
ncbi:MAG: hypothetical protein JXE07_00900 [Candidatus Aminicenantes bacterium]|nr:hypothetical protein [Candidatus Aminicenantes bacterium]